MKKQILDMWEQSMDPDTDPQILEDIAKEKNEIILHNLASNPSTPAYILEGMTEYEDEKSRLDGVWLREAVAGNQATPKHVLENLAFDPKEDDGVLYAIAGNPSTPEHVLYNLANSIHMHVRVAVAQNPSTSAYILNKLALTKIDYDQDFRDVYTVVKAAAQNPHTPPETLEQLASDMRRAIRYEVALNPNTEPQTLKELQDDKDDIVRRAVRQKE